MSATSGADPGFFLGGGTPLRNDVTDRWGKQILKAHPCTFPLDLPLYFNSSAHLTNLCHFLSNLGAIADYRPTSTIPRNRSHQNADHADCRLQTMQTADYRPCRLQTACRPCRLGFFQGFLILVFAFTPIFFGSGNKLLFNYISESLLCTGRDNSVCDCLRVIDFARETPFNSPILNMLK